MRFASAACAPVWPALDSIGVSSRWEAVGCAVTDLAEGVMCQLRCSSAFTGPTLTVICPTNHTNGSFPVLVSLGNSSSSTSLRDGCSQPTSSTSSREGSGDLNLGGLIVSREAAIAVGAAFVVLVLVGLVCAIYCRRRPQNAGMKSDAGDAMAFGDLSSVKDPEHLRQSDSSVKIGSATVETAKDVADSRAGGACCCKKPSLPKPTYGSPNHIAALYQQASSGRVHTSSSPPAEGNTTVSSRGKLPRNQKHGTPFCAKKKPFAPPPHEVITAGATPGQPAERSPHPHGLTMKRLRQTAQQASARKLSEASAGSQISVSLRNSTEPELVQGDSPDRSDTSGGSNAASPNASTPENADRYHSSQSEGGDTRRESSISFDPSLGSIREFDSGADRRWRDPDSISDSDSLDSGLDTPNSGETEAMLSRAPRSLPLDNTNLALSVSPVDKLAKGLVF
eukprot:SAG31_NODE_3628_length_4050_cov_2.582890_5_plen_452_part_00